MATVEFKINLEDEEGVTQVTEMLNCYLNGHRVCAARERNPVPAEKPAEILPPESDIEPDFELDSAGEAWDPDKHSAGRTKLKDGTWRPKRNGTPTEDKPVPPPPPAGEKGMAPEELTYKDMMDNLKGKGLDLAQMNSLANKVGVASIALMINNIPLIPAVLALAETS